MLIWQSRNAEEGGYDIEGDISCPFLLPEGSQEEFIKALLLTEVQEKEPHNPLDWNKCQKTPVFEQILAEETEDHIDTIFKGLSNQKVQWIHWELRLWCLPIRGRKKSLSTFWQVQ